MNQAIQFREDEYLDHGSQTVFFSALQDGHKRICAIKTTTLTELFGEGEPLTIFERFRWDIEEMSEKAITSQHDDTDGYYWLSR